MNKSELVKAMSEKSGLTHKESELALNSFQEAVIDEMLVGGKVKLSGFGTFSVGDRDATTRRNPQTGDPMDCPACKVPKFKISENIKELLNQ